MNINELSHFRNNKYVKFKTETVDNTDLTIVHYMIADSDFWKIEKSLETRGNTYDSQGCCVGACFHKFFNVNEREQTQWNLIKDRIILITEKIDGSLIIPIFINGKIYLKTKKTFYSDVATLANSIIDENTKDFCKYLISQRLTPIFEFTHPDNIIVINYDKFPNFTLLHIRNYETGNYLPFSEVKKLAKQFDINIVSTYNKTTDELLYDIENKEDFEGYVLHLDNNDFVKFKTKWYIKNHRVFTQIRERDIAEYVIDEEIDDIYSALNERNVDIDCIKKIEKKVVDEYNNIILTVETIVEEEQQKNSSIKDVAIKYVNNHKLGGLIMKLYRGFEPDYKDFWKKNYLKLYTLNTIQQLLTIR